MRRSLGNLASRRSELLACFREIDSFYDELDRNLPEWFKKKRLKARRIYQELELKGAPVGKYGKDFDMTSLRPDAAPRLSPRPRLLTLAGEKTIVESVGFDVEERERSGSYLHEDASATYLGFTRWFEEEFQRLYPGRLVVTEVFEAIRRFDWLREFVYGIVPIGLDKYTAFNAAYAPGGLFVWAKEGADIVMPLQGCFYLKQTGLAQVVYILIIAEPNSKAHLISGCVPHPRCELGLHGCISDIYVGKGAHVTLTLIHSYRPGFHVRPKIGAMLDEDAVYVENYIARGPPESIQLYPTAILRGRRSRAIFRSLVVGLDKSHMDVGAAVIYTGEGSSAEIMHRSVVGEESTVVMRGAMKAFKPGTGGHLECRALLLSEKARAYAHPSLVSFSPDANLTHEAAITRIAEDQLYYLMSRGLSESEAVSLVARGFLDTDIPSLPPIVRSEVSRIVAEGVEQVL